jgi:2-succinyl-6-hydroxy-2,4-cyclohexadiene-1-carboxylate synthase
MKTNLVILALSGLVLAGLASCAQGTGPVDRQIDFGAQRIHYEVRGAAAKTLVFIHGWTGSTRDWDYQLDAFPGYRTIAIDLPGNGRSIQDPQFAYCPSFFADAVIRVLETEKTGPAFLVGHSMGLAVCEVLAQKRPELCAGICSLDGSHFELPQDPAEAAAWLEYNRGFAASMASEAGREAFLSLLFLPDSPARLKEEVFAESRRVPLAVARAMIAGVESDARYWGRRTIATPLLAIYSPVYGLAADYGEVLRKTFPDI